MTYGHAWLVWRILALVLIAIYCIAGAIGLVADFGSTRDTVLWVGSCSGRGLLVVGALAYRGVPVHLGRARLDRSRRGRVPALLDALRPARRSRADRARASRSRAGPRLPPEGASHASRLVARGGRRGRAAPGRSRAMRAQTSSSSAAATSGSGRRGTSSTSSRTLDVLILEAEVCGHGPSGRNGGFCETLWPDAATLRERVGDAAALAVCRASEDAVRGIGAWCEAQEVDAWYRAAPMLRVATTESQVGSWADGRPRRRASSAQPEEVVAAQRRRGARALRLAALPRRRALPAERDRAARHGSRSACARSSSSEAPASTSGPRSRSSTETGASRPEAVASARGRRCSPSTRGRRAFPGYRLSLAAASSHIVLTEPVPEVLDELGWTGGEAIVDSRTLVHYMRTTERRPDRLRLGRRRDGLRREGLRGGRSSTRGVIARTRESLVRFFPQLRGRA